MNDYQSKNYVGVFDLFTSLKISFRYGSNSWVEVFDGYISNVKPRISPQGEMLDVAAWGLGWALIKTHCNTSYGVESDNPTLTHPEEILTHLITNYINLSFGVGNTHWGIGDQVEAVYAALDVTSLESPYLDNFFILNRLCDLVNAYSGGLATPRTDPSIHWYVDVSGNLCVKEIDQDHSGVTWQRYWNGTQALSTIEVQKDMILYDFRKNIEEYANKVVLSTAFRKPASDIWTEDNGPVWGTFDATATYSVAQFIVGSHSLLVEPNNAPAVGGAYYPSTRDAHWDFTSCSSQNTIPTLNFYVYASDVNCFGYPVYLFTDSLVCGGAANHYYWAQLNHYMTPRANKWVHISMPIGPHYAIKPELQLDTGADEFEWNVVGAPDWADINGIALLAGAVNAMDKHFDDLHFAGKLIREATDASEITATQKCHQKVLRLDTAVDDLLKDGTPGTTDLGTAAQLCYSELLRRAEQPIVGLIQVPGAESILPGQTIHVHACKQAAGTFRINKDMRVKELKHVFSMETGFKTILNLTDDLMNSHAFGVPTAYSLLKEYAGALGHSEAKDLKASGIDRLLTRLSESY